jgi:hypothetical protein
VKSGAGLITMNHFSAKGWKVIIGFHAVREKMVIPIAGCLIKRAYFANLKIRHFQSME